MKKNVKKITYIYIIVLLVFLQGNVFAQKVGTTSFQFLKIMTDARSTGMGEAFSSAVNNSAAVFWNPGALTKIQNLDFSVSYLDWLLDVTHTSFSGAYRIEGIGVLGFQALVTNVGEINVTRVDQLRFIGDTYNPGLTGETLNPSSMALGLSFAKKLTDKFSFGLTTKYVREDLDVQSKSAIVFDAGLIFQTGYKSLELSAVIRHFGPEIKYIDNSYPLPQTFNLGLSGYLISGNDFFIFPSENNSLLFAYDLSHPRDYNQQHHLGLEYSFNNLIFLRGGYKINYDEEALTFGFGVNVSSLRVDYSYGNFGDYFDAVHRFSLGFNFN